MKILVINSGSSSIKYQVYDTRNGGVNIRGIIEGVIDHDSALRVMGQELEAAGLGRSGGTLDGIGHRIVHGGEQFTDATRLNPEVIAELEKVSALAPLHNPPGLAAARFAAKRWPNVPQVAVFDTSFHQSMPEHAYRYALPRSLYSKFGVRRYGFHGTSHRYVARRAAELMRRPLNELSLVTLHLGNGASAAAIKQGRCVDTSMGLTPLEGLVMGTRCGDIDPALVFYIAEQTGISFPEIKRILNYESGLKGICGSSDMREVIADANEGQADAELALTIYCYRIKKYIGAYVAVLGGLDALVFTAGVGENQPVVRERCLGGLSMLGLDVDPDANAAVRGDAGEIQAASSRAKIYVLPTNEESEIAAQTSACLSSVAATAAPGVAD